MADREMRIDRSKVKDYTKHSVEVDGKKKRVVDNNDEVAAMLRDAQTDEALRAVATEHGLAERFDGWGHLNRGQKRMNLGNALRHKIRKDAEAKAAVAA